MRRRNIRHIAIDVSIRGRSCAFVNSCLFSPARKEDSGTQEKGLISKRKGLGGRRREFRIASLAMACPSDDEVLSTLWLMFGQPRNYFCSRWQKGAGGTRVTHIQRPAKARNARDSTNRPTGALYARSPYKKNRGESSPGSPT
ncbi:unnamed protein product [Lasius platythorax]|uniref:Uncharacterized protein n=1 Tax=Lasius platythorax TaxID=488582 RepID=A0AAV2P655_9HYME